MLVLSTKDKERIVMYGSNQREKLIDLYKGKDIIFSGSKEELLNQSEDWWKGVVEKASLVTLALTRATETRTPVYRDYRVTGFKSISARYRTPFRKAKDSGLSAIESLPAKYYIIVKENLKDMTVLTIIFILTTFMFFCGVVVKNIKIDRLETDIEFLKKDIEYRDSIIEYHNKRLLSKQDDKLVPPRIIVPPTNLIQIRGMGS
jgi:hypothetical protein